MNALGIYFGPQVISVVETRGKRLINHIQIPQLALSPSDLEEKVPDEVKIVAVFKDELRKNKIASKEVTVCLSGRDLIIRTFEMPLFIPQGELQNNAINFEVKKYIPFKVEDLISDFQTQFDKISRRNIILYIGIKKETLDKYLSILKQLEFKVNALEYSAFSLLRFLKLVNIGNKAITGVIGADIKEQNEVNFVVLDKGFPLFSHEISLTASPEGLAKDEETKPAAILEKLKTEINISLDYYHSKFPGKKIQKFLFISSEDYRAELEAFIKDIGLSAQFVDTAQITKAIGRAVPLSLSFIKAYSSSLSPLIKTPLKINLLSTKDKVTKERGEEPLAVPFAGGLKVEKKTWALALLICVLPVIFGILRRIPLEKEINSIINMQPRLPGVDSSLNYEELVDISNTHNEKINALDNLLHKESFLTEAIDLMPRIIPKGMWLVNFTFDKKEGRQQLVLRGIAYLGDNNKELELINKFLSDLKANAYFKKFKQVNITSIEHSEAKDITATNFVISCQDYKEI